MRPPAHSEPLSPRFARAAVLLLALCAGPLEAQVPRRPAVRADTAAARQRRDSLRAAGIRDTARTDTTRAGRGRGLPTKPSRDFATPDSVTTALMRREGFRITRYSADSVRFMAPEKEVRFAGHSLVQRDASTLEADSVRYLQSSCEMRAAGSPHLFDRTGVVVGEGMRYDACNKVGLIARANTDFPEGGAVWHLRGDLAVDNTENRVYASTATITSCDLPDPHYHFAAREVKWVSKDIMVSRPAVLYIADVPILWLPFIFQDLRKGRRSGLIPPKFGINDIVRNSRSYQRHVADVGYYWAISDYADAQATLDWYSQRYVGIHGRLNYRWLNRFIRGGVQYDELRVSGGNISRSIVVDHSQDFSLTTRLTAHLSYVTSAQVISQNAVDPVLAVATIDSRLNYSRRFAGGTLAIGGSRTQSLDRPQVTMNFPVIAFAPQPIALGKDVTWSPSFNFTNATLTNGPAGGFLFSGPGLPDTLRSSSRNSSFGLTTPLRFGRWNWSNALNLADNWQNTRLKVTFADPADSTRTVTRTYAETFSTSLDWSTGISLPVLMQGSWNLAPGVDIANTTGGAFLLRNQFTGGRFVSQGKRLSYRASVSPTFFGLFGGIGPIARLRHSISPSLSWSFAPAATLPEAYALALAPGGRGVNRHIDARQTLSLGLSQNFEAKLRAPPRPAGADSTGAPEPEGRKIKLLSIQSSGVSVDLEQAKKPGHTGWTSQTFANSFSSDLLRGFSLSMTHDLWDGPVGVVGTRFKPFLSSFSMRFSLGAGTLRGIGSLLGFAPSRGPAQRADSSTAPDTAVTGLGTLGLTGATRGIATRTTGIEQPLAGAGHRTPFSASISYDVQKQRPRLDSLGIPLVVSPPRQTLSGSISFSPTAHWSVAWQTQYNITTGKFGEHVVRLDRDMHDWRASFSFVQSPNGNFLFNFFIQLIDQPEIKFDYDQRNLGR